MGFAALLSTCHFGKRMGKRTKLFCLILHNMTEACYLHCPETAEGGTPCNSLNSYIAQREFSCGRIDFEWMAGWLIACLIYHQTANLYFPFLTGSETNFGSYYVESILEIDFRRAICDSMV
jgi:hypothetical protein